MRLRSVHIDRKFIPEFSGNKELPPADQVVVHFSRIPGTAEKSNYKGFKMDQQGSMQLVYSDSLLVSSFVDRIENLELEIDGKIEKIKNGVQLASANNSVLMDLIVEIRDYLFPESEVMPEGESIA